MLEGALARGRVGDDYTTGCLRIARGRDASTLRDYPSRAICDLVGGGGGDRAGRAEARTHVVARPQVATSDPPPPPRAAASPRTSSSKRRTYMCVDRGVRNASLAIYVLRHTSSPALMPATHPPGSSNPSRDPFRGHPPRTSDPSFHPPPRLAGGTKRHATPASDRRDRFAVPSAPVAATTGRGCVHHRTIRRQSIVIQFQARRILSSDFVSLAQLPKWGLREVLPL